MKKFYGGLFCRGNIECKKWRIFDGAMVDFWWISYGFLMDIWRIFYGSLVGFWWVFGGFFTGLWRVFGGFLVGFKNWHWMRRVEISWRWCGSVGWVWRSSSSGPWRCGRPRRGRARKWAARTRWCRQSLGCDGCGWWRWSVAGRCSRPARPQSVPHSSVSWCKSKWRSLYPSSK